MDRVLTDREIAALLKMPKKTSWKTVQKLAREGRIRGQKIGGQWRFSATAVEDFLMLNSRKR